MRAGAGLACSSFYFSFLLSGFLSNQLLVAVGGLGLVGVGRLGLFLGVGLWFVAVAGLGPLQFLFLLAVVGFLRPQSHFGRHVLFTGGQPDLDAIAFGRHGFAGADAEVGNAG